MAEKRRFVSLANKYVSPYALKIQEYFQDVEDDLNRADINLTLTEYLSLALMSAIFVFIFITPAVSLVVGLAMGSMSGIIAGLITGLFLGIFLSVGTFMGFYLYPTIVMGQRRENINHNLPFAAMYLSTVAGTGTPPAAMFKLLGNFEEYGQVSREASKIARDVYSFGADLDEAITRAAQRTPSEKFKELLWGMNSVITTGGDMDEYLKNKTDAYMRDYRRELDKFTDTLSLLVEMYITLVIVGSVFLMILSTIMSALGSGRIMVLTVQVATVFVVLPLAAIMFIVIVKSSSPLE